MYRLFLGDGLTCVAPKRVFLSSHNARKNVILLKSHCTIDVWETGTEIRLRGKGEELFISHISSCIYPMRFLR